MSVKYTDLKCLLSCMYSLSDLAIKLLLNQLKKKKKDAVFNNDLYCLVKVNN